MQYQKDLKWARDYIVPAARAVRVQILERHVAVNRHQGLHYIQTSLTRMILPWTMWLCLEEHTFAKLFEELHIRIMSCCIAIIVIDTLTILYVAYMLCVITIVTA